MVSKKYQPDVDKLLARRHDNGGDFWSTPDGKLLVGDPYSTLTSLLVLHELRVSRKHEAVQGAVELLFASQRLDGRFRIAPKGTMYPCHTALIAGILCRFGYAKDPRLQATFEFLLQAQHQDGGWRCNTIPLGRAAQTDCSNPGVTLFVLDACRFLDETKRSPLLATAVESLLLHWQDRQPMGPCTFGIGTQFLQVEYPFLRYNLFYYVYVLSFYEAAREDSRFQEAVVALGSKLDDRDRLIVERPQQKLGKELSFCEKGQPSQLATRRYGEAMKNLGS